MASPTGWTWLTFFTAVSHAVPDLLADEVIADLSRRGVPLAKRKEIGPRGISFDLPGMVAVDRPLCSVRIGDLRIEIPSEDVVTILRHLRALSVRKRPGGRPYYKLHGFRRSLVLTPEQYVVMVAALERRAPREEARAAAFYATRKTPNEALHEIHAKLHGPEVAAALTRARPDRLAHLRKRGKA